MRMKNVPIVLVLSLVIAGLTLPAAGAEQRGRGRGKTANGPAFCRSGAGHPVHGRLWCLEQGFGLGGSIWRRVQLGTIVFNRVPRGRIENVRLGSREIAEILTDVALDGIFGESHHGLDRSRLGAKWRGGASEGVYVLEVLNDDTPVAELVDTDLDGKVDVILIADREG